MAEQRFLVAPLSEGLNTNVSPWLIPDQAFARLKNAYVYRGRVRKRWGSRLMKGSADDAVAPLSSRLRINLGTTNGSGNFSTTVPGARFVVGQMFSVGDEMFTVNATGSPATLLSTGAATTKTYDTGTGALVINGAATGTDVFFYPADPVMGLITYDTGNINDEPVIAFDRQFAYEYVNEAWQRVGSATWASSDSDFFWGSTYRGVNNYDTYLFVVNNVATDQIKYYDGSTWTTINPVFNSAGDTIETARLVVPFKDRLLLLNTTEKISGTPRVFQARVRYSQNGDPTQTTSGQEAWREDVVGKGGYIDAPTKEQIVSCQFLKDRLIVFFESSTWELAYTGNQLIPFSWQKINTELGAESTFSQVPFDKVVLGIGSTGINACNGANIDRIDQKIDDLVFEIHNGNNGTDRVYGIRDYKADMVYWAYPDAADDPIYPNQILTYSYLTGAWATFDDSVTCFGYYQKEDDTTWADSTATWEQSTGSWRSASLQSGYRDIIAGNQEGFVFIVDQDITSNALSLQITDITVASDVATLTIISHNLTTSDYIMVKEAQGITGLNDTIYQINSTPSADTITVVQSGLTGTYTGGGAVSRVSQIDILTKQYNFFLGSGRNLYINKVDFMVDRTPNGKISIDYSPSSSGNFVLSDAIASGAQLGDNMLETHAYASVPFELTQDRLWHPIGLQTSGECIQLRLFLNDSQMKDLSIALSDFQLHAMMFHAMPTSTRLQ